MRHFPCVFVATCLLQAGQSLVTSTAIGVVIYPSTAPYTNVSDMRVEIRLTNLSTCKSTSGGYGNNLIRLGSVRLGCTQLNTKSLAIENGGLPAPIIATSAQLGSSTDVTLRLQKLTNAGVFVAEVWSTSTRVLLASSSFRSHLATIKGSIAGLRILLPGTAGVGTTNIAWIRLYNTTVPTGVAAPGDTTPCNTSADCIARWEFEGTLAGIGVSGATLNVALPNPVYVATPMYATVPSVYNLSGAITPSSIAAGATVTLAGPVTKTVTAGTSGEYRFTGLTNGTYTVTPKKTGVVFNPAMQTRTINGAHATANFAAAIQTWNISGTVYGSAATVTLSGTASASTSTDANGKYSFSGLTNGWYIVAASWSRCTFTPSVALRTINNGSVSGVNFTAQPVPPRVVLSWTASTSPNVTSYNVYRATTSRGPYTKVNTSPIAALTYVDSSVSSGQVYFYVATAVDSSGNESTYSTEAAATVRAF